MTTDPWVHAKTAATEAALVVRDLDDIDELTDLGAAFDAIWHRTTPMIETAHLKAVAHAGGYVAGAFVGDRMIGGAMGFLGLDDGVLLLHSHVAGFVDGEAGRGRGRALKLHQRAWCLERGIERVEWTFDPLIKRNAGFNLQRLGVTIPQYLVDHYGSLRDDDVNGTDASDRFLARWHLEARATIDLAAGDRIEVDEALLRDAGAADLVTDNGEQTGAEPTTALVRVPDDIVALRRTDPAAAGRWRLATRAALAPRLAAGNRITGFTRSGRYVVAP